MTRRTGHCLCGAVSFSAKVEDSFGACHCTECQRWSGGGPFYAIGVSDLDLTGTEHISSYRHSTWGERAFCTTCGSTLYWTMQDRPTVSVALGLLDDQSGLTLTREIFVDTRAPWMQPCGTATQSTEAQEIAKLDAYLKGDGQ